MDNTSHTCSNDDRDRCASCSKGDCAPQTPVQQERTLDQDIAKLNQDIKTYESGWKRALADYQNLQKELIIERQRMAEWSLDQILEELIPVADHFDEALLHSANGANGNVVFEGFKHIRREIEEIFSRNGVTSFGSVGDRFNTTQYESVGTEVGPPEQEGIVAKVAARGDKRGERVLRPARVIIYGNG